MRIRKANKADIDIAWEIRRASIVAECAQHYSPDIMDPWLNGSLPTHFAEELESNFYVAVANNEIVGLGALNYKDNTIYAIFVKPEFMGKGVGKQMMQFLEDLAIKKKIAVINLNSTLNAVHFYRSLGYIGDEIVKYSNPRGFVMDCVAMEKHLNLS